MSNLAMWCASLPTALRRIGSVAIGIFVWSMVLGTFSSTPTTFAANRSAAHPQFSSRVQIDGTVRAFKVFSPTLAQVLGQDGKLWELPGPFGPIPPSPRIQLDANVSAFQADGNTDIFVLGTDGTLWDDHPTLLTQGPVPPPQERVDGNVISFIALNSSTVFELKNDNTLWLVQGTFGVPRTPHTEIDVDVRAFKLVSPTEVLVLTGSEGSLWDERAPFGTVPPARTLIDRPVSDFQFISSTEVFVLGTDGNLWDERGPFGSLPNRIHVDTTVRAFKIEDDFPTAQRVLVLGTNGNLWDEHAPYGTVPPARTFIDGTVAQFDSVSLSTSQFAVEGTDAKLWLESLS